MKANRVLISKRLFTIAMLLVCLTLFQVQPVLAGGDWNDEGIAWKSHEAGLAEAKQAKKPVCLIFFTEWCPHCKKYSEVFHDPQVVAKAKEFVMIRVDKDKNTELSKQHAADGEYIPRTYFLTSEGVFDPTIKVPREKYQYFYDTQKPAGVLAGMSAALKKLR